MNSPNIIVYDGENKFSTTIAKVGSAIQTYNFNNNQPITAGSGGEDTQHSGYFYICNKSTDSSPSRDLVNPKIKLQCTKCANLTTAVETAKGYNHIALYTCTDSNKTGTSISSANIQNDIDIQSAAGVTTIKGAANNATLTNENYSMIRVEAKPLTNAGAGDYTYTLSIKGTYT